MAIKRYNSTTSLWEVVGTPGTVTASGIGAVSISGGSIITSSSASVKPLVIKGTTSQSANLLELLNSSNTSLIVADPSGNLGIGATSPAGKIHTYSALSSSVGSQSLTFQSQVDNGNQDYIKVYQERTTTTQSWAGSDWIIRRQVDASPMGGFRWAAGDWNVRALYGTPSSPSIRTSHISTSAPTGGIDGDIWLVYTA
jgi:hypothetical protein